MRELLFSPEGRVSRKSLWIFLSANLSVILFAFMIDYSQGYAVASGQAPLITTAVRIAFVWPNAVMSIKRFHDIGLSYRWALPVAILEIAVLIEFISRKLSDDPFGSTIFDSTPASIVILMIYLTQWVFLFLRPGMRETNRFGANPLLE